MEYYIAITETKQALLLPNCYKPESGVLIKVKFTVFGLEELQKYFDMKYVQKFVGTIVGYALRGTKNINKNLKQKFFDIVFFLEGKQFINDCFVLGKQIKEELFCQKLIINSKRKKKKK